MPKLVNVRDFGLKCLHCLYIAALYIAVEKTTRALACNKISLGVSFRDGLGISLLICLGRYSVLRHGRHGLLRPLRVRVPLLRALLWIHVCLDFAYNTRRIARNHMKWRYILHPVYQLSTYQLPLFSKTHTLVTTLPAPTVEPLPTVTPGRIVAFPPIQQSSPM